MCFLGTFLVDQSINWVRGVQGFCRGTWKAMKVWSTKCGKISYNKRHRILFQGLHQWQPNFQQYPLLSLMETAMLSLYSSLYLLYFVLLFISPDLALMTKGCSPKLVHLYFYFYCSPNLHDFLHYQLLSLNWFFYFVVILPLRMFLSYLLQIHYQWLSP